MKESKKKKCDLCNIESLDLKQELVPTRGYRYVMKSICPDCQVTLVDYVLSKFK